jgi:hypothetical protein
MSLFAKVSQEDVAQYNRRMWEGLKLKYPFHATSSSVIHPSTLEEIYGKFASVELEPGKRIWGFASEKCRDIFVKRKDARAI